MEWVETAAKTMAEAKEAALDELGVDESDAEFEVVEEPKPGLFGRVRGEARIRARVAPRQQRPKQERRDRRPRSEQTGSEASAGTPDLPPPTSDATSPGEGQRSRNRGRQSEGNGRGGGSNPTRSREVRTAMTEEMVSVQAQADIMGEFLKGLVDSFGLEAEVSQLSVDEETIELNAQGGDLGLLIGPKGQTLGAIQELSRTVLQRRATGTYVGRVRIDVSGYRQRRREALERFAHSVADQVIESGDSKALEPMNAADRKVVHDTINERHGVQTMSEGEEPRRRVVIEPVIDSAEISG